MLTILVFRRSQISINIARRANNSEANYLIIVRSILKRSGAFTA